MQKFNLNMFIYSFTLTFLASMLQEAGVLDQTYYNDMLIGMLTLLTIYFFFVICMINMKNFFNSFFVFISMMLFIILMFFFFQENMIMFYILFEMSIIPMLFFVSGWGYSLERIKAMMYMLMYTLIFSLPFLICLIFYNNCNKNLFCSLNLFFIFSSNELFFFFYPLIFLVKIPIWGFHFWLPKAHVEASTEGSMLLAGIILKLSGLGLVKFSFFQASSPHNNFILYLFLSLSAMGALMVSIMALRQSDSKLMVALSSVIHMGIIFICYFFSSTLSLETLFLMMICHGYISPLMFYFLNSIYEKMISRSIFFNRGILKNFSYMSMFWFLLCAFNMGIPLTMNFLSEMEFFFLSVNFSMTLITTMIIIVLTGGALNMHLYNYFSGGDTKMLIFLKEFSWNLVFIMLFFFYLILFYTYMEEM